MNIIRVYDYSESKMPLMNYIIENLKNELQNKEYYTSMDWVGGPNIKLTFKNGIDKEMKEIIEDLVIQFKKKNTISEEKIQTKKVKYLNSSVNLEQLESRGHENKEIKDDGEVIFEHEKRSGRYNSNFHYNQFKKYRFMLQKAHGQISRCLELLSDLDKHILFVQMFFHIASLYEDGLLRGYLSYVSHVQGFFSKLRDRNYEMEDKFEKKYLKLEPFIENAVTTNKFIDRELELWRETWNGISKDMKENFSKKDYQEEGFMELGDQFKMFVGNASKLTNNFHKRLMKKDDLADLMNSEKMLVYRNLVNLFYLGLPGFEQGMVEKQFYCYCIARYIENHYDEELLIKWK